MSRTRIEYAPGVERALVAVRDRRLLLALRARIAALAEEPRPPKVKKLKGRHEQWRVREQDWRIVYRVEDGRLVVLVVSLAKRDEAYR